MTSVSSLRNQTLFWIGVVILLTGLLWLFRPVLMPFVVGMAIAYLLNPLVNLLGRRGLSRLAATCLILTVFVCLVLLLFALLLPPLYREALQLAQAAPAYADNLWQRLQPLLTDMQAQLDNANLQQSLRDSLRSNVNNLLGFSANMLAGLQAGGQALMGLVSFAFLTPLVAFMMMLEWPAIYARVDELIPRQHYEQVRDLLHRIDARIAGFIRGQLLIALALGIIYALALSMAGLQFGFLIGAGAGLLSIIPLFGSVVGLLVATITAWFQSGETGFTALIAGIFIVGQLLEGNVITPKLMGSTVGLHPLWILFSLLAGGAFLGIVGMLLAIPVAATIGVLLGFTLEQYKNSSYYDHEKQ